MEKEIKLGSGENRLKRGPRDTGLTREEAQKIIMKKKGTAPAALNQSLRCKVAARKKSQHSKTESRNPGLSVWSKVR